MAKVVYEYKDDSGMIHRVDDVQKVPRQFFKTMTAIGSEEPDRPGPAGQPGQPVDAKAPPRGTGDLGSFSPAYLLVPLGVLVAWKSTNFILRIVVVLLLVFFFFTHGFELFMHSDLAKTDTQLGAHPGNTW